MYLMNAGSEVLTILYFTSGFFNYINWFIIMIKYFSILIINLLFSLPGYTGNNLTHSISLVPRPTQIVPGNGNYLFSAQTLFVVENKEQKEMAELFTELFTHAAGFTPEVKIGGDKGDIRFVTDTTLKSEGYSLNVSSREVLVKASDNKGFFYALQTIRQLLPAAIEGERVADAGVRWEIPAVSITDKPRFGYRGLMLDVARCFLPKENILRIIDCMGMLKINTLHFHLVDDNGWRLEIKKYPKLTEVGAWRVDRTDVPFPLRRNQKPGEATPIGGFYTQDEIKEIIAYAAQRQIEVIPEIEMPAHSNAALASYPQFACPVVDKFISVIPGMGGDNSGIVFCAGNDSVFTFFREVIDEVADLFPSRYIHLGGDEASKVYWRKCPLCQARMKQEHLAHEEELQGYFMNRVGGYVRNKGKEVMGWDELTNSELPEGAIIYGWRGFGQAATKAAAQGHRFIMTPARVTYLIRYQGPQWFEPLTYFGNITLKDVYDYEPVQKDWKPEYASLLMGIQASMWTEFCDKPEDVEYQVFPRLAALAEVAWTQPEHKNWPSFLKALDGYTAHLEKKKVTVAQSMYNIQHTVLPQDGKLQVKLECIRPDVEIRYTTDGSAPTPFSTLYKQVLTVNHTQTIQVATFANGRQMGKTLTLPIYWNKATAKSLLGNKQNENVLTNGLRGSLKQSDFEWCSWEKNDSIDFTIDLLQSEKLDTLILGCITNYAMGAHKPRLIHISVSEDNKEFVPVGELHFTPEEIFKERTSIDDLVVDMKGIRARYVRVLAQGAGYCPADHVRPGQVAKVFFDEIIIQ